MSQLSVSVKLVTMTSLELVEYINNHRRHDEAVLAHSDFLKKVSQVLGKKDAGKFSGIYKDSMNRQKPYYTFPKREACLMAMSYSYELQAKVFDRMTELEARPLDPMRMLNDATVLCGLLLTYRDKELALEERIGVLEPKAKALDQIAASDCTMNVTVVAKILQLPPQKLFDYLRREQWIYRRPGGKGNVAYQDKIYAGLLTQKSTRVERDDGTEKFVKQLLVTGKGLVKLSQDFSSTIQ